MRWKVALGLEMGTRPFAELTLQLFRAQLILHQKMRLPFERSLEMARRQGFLKRERKLIPAVDRVVEECRDVILPRIASAWGKEVSLLSGGR